ncbi:MAG TPA: transketolase [Salinivirgaceae bacterium]|nr:transketolase [Salinivirgaceae bacterium]
MIAQEQLSKLNGLALQIRKDILEMLFLAGSGHLGGSIGSADIFTALYFHLLRHNPLDPSWKDRDRVILSAGHLAPVLYATLARCGYFPIEEIKTLRKIGSRLQGHPSRLSGLPGVETSSGSLGQGLSIGVGMALAAKIRNQQHKIVTIHGDGELQEGQIWEAAMSAAHYELSNLIAIVDRNSLQIDGNTEDVLSLEPLKQKWQAFGWNVIQCNGNSIAEFIAAYRSIEPSLNMPSVIIANTTMGAGVAMIENDHRWHGKAPNKEEYLTFLNALQDRFDGSNAAI